MQAPINTLALWSKIWIAELVPVTLAPAVAVRTVSSPGFRALTLAVSWTRGWGPAAESVQLGMLGVTRGGRNVAPVRPAASDGWFAGRTALSHAAGATGTSSTRTGHALVPAGSEATPGAGCPAESPAL